MKTGGAGGGDLELQESSGIAQLNSVWIGYLESS